MNLTKSILILFLTTFTMSCSSNAVQIPLSKDLLADSMPRETYVWVGKGESYVFQDGKWKRNDFSDYDFSVTQRRYDKKWISVKNQLRRHPKYDESAGSRTQTHLFTINYKNSGDNLRFELVSTFGNGMGEIDANFERGTMVFKADVSSFAPFSHYKITQEYYYNEGMLKETVLLFKKKDNGEEIPFVKIEEMANLAKITK